MNIKEKYLEGNNFILSPNGVISRTRYFLYAILLDVLYRVFNAIGGVIGKEVSWFFYIIALITIPIIVLKLFNYKKRAFSFLNNNTYSYLYAVIYIILGILTQGYLYLLKLDNQKAIYELTHDSIFQHYANINVPSFIGVEWCQIVFYILCGIGFIMFLALICIPSKVNEVEIDENNNLISSNKSTKFMQFIKNNKYRTAIIILSTVIFMLSSIYAYSKYKIIAYEGITYKLSQEEINDLNETLKVRYESAIYEYTLDMGNYNSRVGDSRALVKLIAKPVKPPIPQFYGDKYSDIYKNMGISIDDFDPLVESGIILGYRRYNSYMEHFNVPTNVWVTLVNSELDYFSCNYRTYGIFNNNCGRLKFNNENTKYINGDNYKKFNPKTSIIGIWTILLFVSILISFSIIKFLLLLLPLLKKIDFKNIIKVKLPHFKFKSKSSLANKLEELNSLKEQGLITEEDYNNKKSKLLDEF